MGERWTGEEERRIVMEARRGRRPSLADLMEPVRPGEEHPGGTTRLGAYAARLWLPLLQAQDGGR